MPHLRLLDLQKPFPPEHNIVERLASELPNLEFVGLGNTFWKIVKRSPSLEILKMMRSRFMLDIAYNDEPTDEQWLMDWRDVEEEREPEFPEADVDILRPYGRSG